MTRIDHGRQRAEDQERPNVPTDAEMRLRARTGFALFLVAALAVGISLIVEGCFT